MCADFSDAIAYKIHKAVFVMDKVADSALRQKLNITLSQFLILMSIKKNPNITQIQVADFLEQTQAAVSRQIDVLKNKKLIEITKNQDNRRENLLSPTSVGQKTFTEANEVLHKTFDDLYKVMSEKEKDHLEKSLDKLLFTVCGKRRTFDC
ncbi:MAG: hypothetical protein ACD_37C00681G0005 [uncultured bacterium]|nr:MAG: hypothetical protein ACD_37C00681G0005 [uncultured bacterium]